MEPAFEDLAEQEDIQTAKFAAKRLEYRATDHLNLKGSAFSFEAYLIAVLLGILTFLVVLFIDLRFIRKKKKL
jgi:hypothetical protein